MTDANINLSKAVSSDCSTVDLSSPISASPPPPDIKAKHQFLTADDVRHFVLPHLPPNGSDNAAPYFSSILRDHNGNMTREIADFHYSDSDGYETSITGPPPQPQCCFVGVVTASIGSVLATVAITILFAIYLFIVLKGRNELKDASINFSLIGTLVAICAILTLFSASFIYGTIKNRRRLLIPLILLCVCFCVASIGTFVAITITAIDDINEAIQKANDDRTLIIANIVVFRVAFVVFIILQLIVIICYIRCYRYVSRNADE